MDTDDFDDDGSSYHNDLLMQELEQTMSNATTFDKLASLDCGSHIEKKGGFSYLSWPWAVKKLREIAPGATWEVRRFEGLPYQKTECGYFVEVAVTVDGVTLSQIHPVLDQRNRPIPSPDAFQINTSIQRCLVKAIALHGLGLYVYAGEDLPEGAEPHAPATISAQQAAMLTDALRDSKTDPAKFCAHYGIKHVADLPATSYAEATDKLQTKLKRPA